MVIVSSMDRPSRSSFQTTSSPGPKRLERAARAQALERCAGHPVFEDPGAARRLQGVMLQVGILIIF
jgi:hypothetical protein